jgi:copper chaperone
MQHTFDVHGMTCGHCEKAVTQAIHRLNAQATVQIDRAHNQVRVASEQTLDVPAIAAAIREEGYEVKA